MRLNEELLTLRIQNMKLNHRIEGIAENSSLSLRPPIDPQKAMVVFDLQKSPPVVLTANEFFCKMVGYDMVKKEFG
jgi:hypothetical protein